MPFRHLCNAAVLSTISVVFSHSASAELFSPSSPWMLGDWGGDRQKLGEEGIDLEFSYLSEVAGNIHGGYSHRTARYADQWSIGAKFDLEKLLAWDSVDAEIRLSNRNGHGLDAEAINDPRVGGFGSTQEINGRGSVTRLSQFWISKGWLDDRLNIKAGRFTVGDEFATADCAFQNLAFCGSQPGNYVSDIYNSPISSWALRAQYKLTEELTAKIATYNVDPSSLENDNGLKLRTHETAGTMVPVELVWAPMVKRMPGEYRLGYFYNTVNRADVLEDEQGQFSAQSGRPYKVHDSRHGWWITAKQQLTTVDGDYSRGLVLAASATFQDRATTPVDSYQHVSLVYKGPFSARPRDQLGFGVARVHASNRYLENAELLNQKTGAVYSDPLYVPEQHTAYMWEINYRLQATPWLHFMPNIQYIQNPGNVREVDNALVLGLQTGLTF